MGEASPVHRYYYSTYHLAGDFVWGIAVASLFLTLASLLLPEIRSTIWIADQERAGKGSNSDVHSA
jgi:hypothetical protein